MKIAIIILGIIGLAYAKDWWENGNYYQIYPRSFKDSDGDGIGDLNGISEQLQYLKDIGMTAVWLSPIFQSPMVDFGYDISDYQKIHSEYGTNEDFDNLLKKAKEIGLKIILDLVPNHTSDEHDWFVKSVKKIEPYTNYYIWADPITDENGNRQPPSNWLSAFRFSAWEWNEERKQYYLHQFAIKQPDLNYRNENVVKEMKNIMKYWLGKGVSGFRIDAVPFLFEKDKDKDGFYLNEPVNANCPNKDDYCHTQHIYTNDQPETYDMAYQWRELCDVFKKENGGETRILMTEAYTSLANTIRFYGDGRRNGSHIPFNFELINNLNKDSTAKRFDEVIDSWLKVMPSGFLANWVMGNHDNKRLASRFGINRADLLNIMLQTLPGNAVTYNGEEIAMLDVDLTWEETVDPQGCNAEKDKYNLLSRDPARTPFQWDASPNSGFSSGNSKPWLRVHPDYKTNNVLMQLRAPISHLHVFKKLTKLRKEPSFISGAFEKKVIGDDIIVYKREKTDSDKYIIVLNFGKTNKTINLKDYFPNIYDKVEIITTSIQSTYTDGDVVKATEFEAFAEVGAVVVSVA